MVQAVTRNNPFPGLRPFGLDEEHLFFGREGQADELLVRLNRTRFLAVVGTSGSGKSSLVKAGLLPSLYSGFLADAGSRWRVAFLRPGNAPIRNLAEALNDPEVFGVDPTRNDAILYNALTESTLRRGTLGLVAVTQQARMATHETLLIVVDQFEEIFRFKQQAQSLEAEDEAAAFVKLLLAAVNQRSVPIFVVLTMRSDFLGDCAQFRDLPEALNDSEFLVPRFTRDQLQRAIEGPVAVGGATITPRLVNRLLNDVGDNPDQLPILQHALMRTWDYWTDQNTPQTRIDIWHYNKIGGMGQALSRHADQIYDGLPNKRSRQIAENLFKCLTNKEANSRVIRYPTQISEICSVVNATSKEVFFIIEHFRAPRRSFLMPPPNVKLHDTTVIDISHESLMRNWQRLKGWVSEEYQSVIFYKRLSETAELKEQEKAGFLQDPELALAVNWWNEKQPNAAWAERYSPNFKNVKQFLLASQEENKIRLEILNQTQRGSIRRTRLFSIILGLFASLAIGVAIFAIEQQKLAQEKTIEAEQQKIEAEQQRDEAERQRKLASELSLKVTSDVKRASQQGKSAAELEEEISKQANLSQAEALEVINKWLSSKEKIFSPPYNRSLAEEIATSSFLQEALGASKWLQENESFYQYEYSKVNSVSKFSSRDKLSIIEVNLSEKQTLHSPRGIDSARSDESTENYRYTLELVNGSWKISASEKL